MIKRLVTLVLTFAAISMARAQLPSPTYGWNLGNTLEAPTGEGTWGPVATQNVINAVAASGINVIRIPCAWNSNADQATYQINPTYMARVKQVVDWCYAKNLYVVVNSHWDNGWLDAGLNANGTVDPVVNAKMNSYWTQIANTFKGYDSHLLFAGCNEPIVNNSANAESELLTYEQTFVNAVRATGGNNSTRWLVIQGPNTDITETYNLMNTMPTDSANPARLAVEVHYYAPWQYVGLTSDQTWGNQEFYWGTGYLSTTDTAHNAPVGAESVIDTDFDKMVTKFVSKGIPVIIGEFGCAKRSPQLTGAALDLHVRGRTYYHKYIEDAAHKRGIYPMFWDIAGIDFDWTTGAVTDPDTVRVITGGAALPPPDGGGIITNGIYKIINHNSGLALDVTGGGRINNTNVEQWSYSGGANQQWTLMHLGNNVYKIVGLQSGRCLDVYGASSANGANVEIWDSTGGTNQQWQISALGNGYYRLTPMNATGSALDVSGWSTANGGNIQIWQYTAGANQQWIFQAP